MINYNSDWSKILKIIKEIEILFVLYHGWKLKSAFTPDCINHLMAALDAIRINNNLRICFVGGKSPQDGVDAGAIQMRKWFCRKIKEENLSCQHVAAFPDSNNTAGNIEDIKGYLSDPNRQCGILSSDYHLNRIWWHLRWTKSQRKIFNTPRLSAEKIRSNIEGPAIRKEMEKFMSSPYYQREIRKEFLYTIYFSIDRRGRFPTLLRKIMRGRE